MHVLAHNMASTDPELFANALSKAIQMCKLGEMDGLIAIQEGIKKRSKSFSVSFFKPGITLSKFSRFEEAEEKLFDLARKRALLVDPFKSGSYLSALINLRGPNHVDHIISDIFSIGGDSEGQAIQLLFWEMKCNMLLKR